MISLIFLAGGIGSRMGSPIPKQYLSLKGKPIARHSFDLFVKVPEIAEIVVVCEPEYQHFFLEPIAKLHDSEKSKILSQAVLFAQPGRRRQDSVYAGLQKCSQKIIFTHDSVRPFFEMKYIPLLIEAVQTVGAAALAAPITSTIKQSSSHQIVEKTIDRSCLWEAQTPQAASRDLFFKAYDHIRKHNLEVTDDLSAFEAIGHFGKLIPSTSRNLKITTPFDLAVAEILCATS